MTDGMNLPEKLTAQPGFIADVIFKSVLKQKNVIYSQPIWWLIMMFIRNIPERIFKRMKI